MLPSVFTPSDNPRFLNDAYRSLRSQTLADWEWIVLLKARQQGLATAGGR